MPRRILVMEILHQIPLSPNAVEDNAIERGILETTSRVVAMEGERVRPYPAKAPAVIILSLIHI